VIPCWTLLSCFRRIVAQTRAVICHADTEGGRGVKSGDRTKMGKGQPASLSSLPQDPNQPKNDVKEATFPSTSDQTQHNPLEKHM